MSLKKMYLPIRAMTTYQSSKMRLRHVELIRRETKREMTSVARPMRMPRRPSVEPVRRAKMAARNWM
jgi:hypothetical protein